MFVPLFYHFKYVWYIDVNLFMIILNLGESVGRLYGSGESGEPVPERDPSA